MRLTCLQIRRNAGLPGTGDADNLPALGRPFARGRPAHAAADLRGVHVELGERAAERIAMHAQFLGCFALVPFVLRQNFKYVPPFELA